MAATAPLKRQAAQVVKILQREYPDAHCALEFRNPLELLVATILSAQCTDERVNMVTQDLFRKYRTAADYAAAPLAELERDIQSTGFFRNKAKNIQACCQALVEQYGGEVPTRSGDAGRAARRRPQDGQRRAGHRLRHRLGRRGRHARRAGSASGWASPSTRTR